jgi:hypothetical protein
MGDWGAWGTVLVMRQGPSYSIPIHLGWNLISLPLITASNDISVILADISWDLAYAYDPLDLSPWLSNRPASPTGSNDLTYADRTMGIWVHVTSLGDGYLDISGAVPASTAITLHAGWNLVGYPTLAEGVSALAALAGTGADMMAVFDAASPTYMHDITNLSDVTLAPGDGYWIHVPADIVWVIDW